MAGVATMEDWTAGDYGGAFAGVVAALAALGKGIAWLLNWQGAREDRRAAKLQAWEDSLTRREKEQREELERRFEQRDAAVADRDKAIDELRHQVGALGASLFDVTAALRTENPTSPALARAAASLRTAFPAEVDVPIGLAELIATLDRKDEEGKST